MTGLVRRATLITAVGLLAASAAMAGVPSASTSSQPTPLHIRVVGHNGGVPDPVGQVTYTIRDAANNPVPGSVVILNYAGCDDTRLCQTEQAGLTVNCGAGTVSGVTNGAGQVTISVIGGSTGLVAPFETGPCVSVTADGVPLSNLHVHILDTNGTGGVELLDVGIAYADHLAGAPERLRSDHDDTGDVTLLDVGIVYAATLGGLGRPNASSCTTLCP